MSLSFTQRATFEEFGYLHLEHVLTSDLVAQLSQAVSVLCTGRQTDPADANDSWWQFLHAPHTEQGPTDRWQSRNIVTKHLAFLQLVDHPATLTPAVEILGCNIALLSSHAMVRWRCSLDAETISRIPLGWHRDLGTSSADMGNAVPRLAVKAAFWLTEVEDPRDGPMWVVPGSHRLMGKPPVDPTTGRMHGATPILASPGDVTLFEQRLWHAASANLSNRARVALFYCYGYRWLRPQDYSVMPESLLSSGSPVMRQLLGGAVSEMGYHLPTPADLPLRKWLEDGDGFGP